MNRRSFLSCTPFLASLFKPAAFTPAVTAPLPRDKVLLGASVWASVDPDQFYHATVEDTRSMEPFFTKKSVVLLLRYQGQALPNGTVVVFNRGDAGRVMHVIADQTADSVYMSGYNNRRSDGWHKKSAIEGIVVGQLYLP